MGFSLLFLACDLKFGNLELEFCSLGVQVWNPVLGFVVRCLGFRMLEFGYLNFGFWARDLEFGMLDLEFGNLEFRV